MGKIGKWYSGWIELEKGKMKFFLLNSRRFVDLEEALEMMILYNMLVWTFENKKIKKLFLVKISFTR